MDTTETPQKVRFLHKKAENYQSYYANGVFGAVTGRGDFEMNFFFEHSDLPEEEVMNYVKGELKPLEQNPTEVIVTRDFKVGIILTPENAEAIGKWLLSVVEEYRERQKNIE